MRSLGKLVLSVVVFVIVFLLVGFVVVRSTEGLDLGGPGQSEGEFVLSLLLFPVVPLVIGHMCAAGTWRFFRRHADSRPDDSAVGPEHSHWKTLVIRLAVAGYLFTWAFGVPAVQTSIDGETVSAYKHLKQELPEKVRDSHPHMRSYVSFPVLPGLIATYHEYQTGVLSGWGGWELYVWHFTGTKEVLSLMSWVS